MEEVAFKIILHAGDARSNCLRAMKHIRNNDFEMARMLIKQANEDINQAHKVQTELIHGEVNGNKVDISLLLIHSQDHLMSAQAIRDVTSGLLETANNLTEQIKEIERRLDNE